MGKIVRLLLVAFFLMFCGNSFGQSGEDDWNADDSIKLDSTKFYFSKAYAIDKLPSDVYNYVPKDTLDKWLPILKQYTDTISIVPRTTSPDKANTSRVPRTVKRNLGGGHLSCHLGSYENFFGKVFSLDYTVSYSFEEKQPTYLDSYCSIHQEFGGIEQLEIRNLSDRVIHLHYSECIGVPCRAGMTCDFAGSGEIHGKIAFSNVSIVMGHLYDFDFVGTPENAECHITPHKGN